MTGSEPTKIQELLCELRVADVMHDGLIKILPSVTMEELRTILRDNRISGVPVESDGELLGIISLDDFIRWVSDGARDETVGDRMTTDVDTVYDSDPLVQAIKKLERMGYGRLPILNRKTGKLQGLLTKGDIIAGLLKKIDIDYRLAEAVNTRSSHVFEDIVADDSCLTLGYDIGADPHIGGVTASSVKTTLVRLGIPPKIVRRTAIAVYEAEMNMIFYAGGGRIEIELAPDVIELCASDQGAGIPDIEKAMQPGFSTAPASVRELGFGAGMGLCNIKASTDRMTLESVVGEGTTLRAEINMDETDET